MIHRDNQRGLKSVRCACGKRTALLERSACDSASSAAGRSMFNLIDVQDFAVSKVKDTVHRKKSPMKTMEGSDQASTVGQGT